MSFLPLTAGAVAPLVIGGIAGIGVIAGFSIYRNAVPMDMASALDFFTSCWSCGLFSDVMSVMSGILPGVYHAIGTVVLPFAVILTALWFAWQIASDFINGKNTDGVQMAGGFGVHLVRLAVVMGLLMAPLPRMMNDIVIAPIFNVGLSLNRAVSNDDSFAECVVATAIADPASVDAAATARGAYSPAMRHDLACELASVHQMTGLGMTMGWTMVNMAFDEQYMHKIMWNIPIFPNVPIFFFGLMVLVLYFFALLPIPMFFLEIFIKLSMDLIMLPLMLLSWLFGDWKLLPGGKKSIQTIIDDVISGTLGIAMVGVFITFATMFLNAAFGNWAGAGTLAAAIANNDSQVIMNGITMHNDSLVIIILMGVFIAMFMTMIPALIKTLFNVSISEDFYNTAKNNINVVWNNMKKWYTQIKK